MSLLLAFGMSARADDPGPYIALGGGANWVSDGPFRGGSIMGEASYENGWATIGGIGLALTRNWRAEAEIGYRRNDVHAVTGGGGGEVDAWSGMGNLLFDVDTGSNWTPYIGAGIGTLRYRATGVRTSAGSLSDDDVVLAYQGIVGVSYAVTPNSRFFLDYHYLRTDDPGVRDSAGNNLRTEYRSSTVLLGLRFTLAPPPGVPR